MRTTKVNASVAFVIFTIYMAMLVFLSWSGFTKKIDLPQIELARLIITCTKTIMIEIWFVILFIYGIFMFHKEKG